MSEEVKIDVPISSGTDVPIQVDSVEKIDLGSVSNDVLEIKLDEIQQNKDAYSVSVSTEAEHEVNGNLAEESSSHAVVGNSPQEQGDEVAVQAQPLVAVAKIDLGSVPSAVLGGIGEIGHSKDAPYVVALSTTSGAPTCSHHALAEAEDRSVVGDSQARGDQAAGAVQPRSRPSPSSIREVQYALRMDKTRTTRHLDDMRGVYHSLESLKSDFAQSLQKADLLSSDVVVDETFQIGFIRPGHGAKGQKMSLSTEADLVQMYEVCRSRRNDILLWYSLVKEARVYESYEMLASGANGKQRRPSSPSLANSAKRRRLSMKAGSPTVVPLAWSPAGIVPVSAGMICAPAPLPTTSAELMQLAGVSTSPGDSGVPLASHGAKGPIMTAFHAAGPTLEKDSPPMHGQHVSPQSMQMPGATARRLSLPMQTPTTEVLIDNRNGTPSCEVSGWSLHVLRDRVDIRKALIQQLREWNDLKQNAVIEEDVYMVHKNKILADLDRV